MFYKLITLLFFTFFSFSASSDPFTNVIGTINQQQQEVIEEKPEETAELKPRIFLTMKLVKRKIFLMKKL